MKKRFYVSYVQEGTSTMWSAHGVIKAESWRYARANWEKIIGDMGYSCQSVGGQPPTALFELPASMRRWPEKQILAHYAETKFKDQWVAPEDTKPFVQSFRAFATAFAQRLVQAFG